MSNVIHRFSDFVQRFIDRYKNLGYKAKKKIRFVIGRIFLYYVLIELAYLFLLPFIYILTTSMMSYQDYLDPTVEWIPTAVEWENFTKAWQGLDYARFPELFDHLAGQCASAMCFLCNYRICVGPL